MNGSTGEALWSRIYSWGDTSHESLYGFVGDEAGDGYAVGRFSTDSNGDDIAILKFAGTDGDVEWTRLIDGPHSGDDRGWNITIATDGHPVITGVTTLEGGNAEYLTAKLNKINGEIIWMKDHPGAINNINEPAGWLAACDNGDVIMVNRTWSASSSYDVVLFCFAGDDGSLVWNRTYNSAGTTSDNPMQMTRNAAGDILVVGVTDGDYMALKFDGDNGDLIWSNSYDGPPGWYDMAKTVIEGDNGDVIVSGFSDGSGSGWDITTVGFAGSNGELLWTIRDDGPGNQSDEGNALALHGSGGLYIVGYVTSQDADADFAAYSYLLSPPVSGCDDLVTGASLLTISPVPGNEAIQLTYTLPEPGVISLAIYSADGRCVKVLKQGITDSGRHQISFDGKDQATQKLESGVYYARITSDGSSQTRRIILTR